MYYIIEEEFQCFNTEQRIDSADRNERRWATVNHHGSVIEAAVVCPETRAILGGHEAVNLRIARSIVGGGEAGKV